MARERSDRFLLVPHLTNRPCRARRDFSSPPLQALSPITTTVTFSTPHGATQASASTTRSRRTGVPTLRDNVCH